MNKLQKQDSLKEMLDMLKGDYSYPVKLWIWGKIVKEWAGIIIGTIIFLFILVFFVFRLGEPSSKVKEETISEQKQEIAPPPQQEVILPMKDIVAFMALCQRSIKTRQEIFQNLMRTIASYENQKVDQKNVEFKLKALSRIFSECNTEREMVIDEFTKDRNPLDIPEVKAAFDKWIDNPKDFFRRNNKVLNAQWEMEQWGQLCELCQNEVKKANKELRQILKAGGNAQ